MEKKFQEFVASTGLMEHLLAEILKGGFQCATSLQINFDLLGELIKFNQTLFQQLNRLLVGDKFDRFVEVSISFKIFSFQQLIALLYSRTLCMQ
jgi:Trpc4-associated protein